MKSQFVILLCVVCTIEAVAVVTTKRGGIVTNKLIKGRRNATMWAKLFELEGHVEGGRFVQTYKSNETIGCLPERYGENATRALSTHIYFLLENKAFSAFHQLTSDEIWHWYHGSSLAMYVIQKEDGQLRIDNLGPRYGKFVTTIKAGDWYAAKVKYPRPGRYCLVGGTVAPGFEYTDFRLAKADELVKLYPRYQKIIRKLSIL